MTQRDQGASRLARWRAGGAAIGIPTAAVVVGLVLALSGGSSTAATTGSTHHSATVAQHREASKLSPKQRRAMKVPARVVLVRLKHSTPGFHTATATHSNGIVQRKWHDTTMSMPALAFYGTRVLIMLPGRPNESTRWVSDKAARFSRTSQALLIDLSQRRLYLYDNRQQKGSFPVGIGKAATPTPTGVFYLALYSRAPEAGIGYGPIVLQTSAHSNVIQHFGGGSDAIIAIHGPIGAGREIGTHGAQISHGCVRMHMKQLKKLYFLAQGTPIIIVH